MRTSNTKVTATYEDGLELVWEKKNYLCGRITLRVYKSRFSPVDLKKPIEEWRYHFGFPREMVESLAMLLETSVYWGEKHWKEHEGFWLWMLTVTGEKTPWNKLNRQLTFMVKSYNQVLRFYEKSSRANA